MLKGIRSSFRFWTAAFALLTFTIAIRAAQAQDAKTPAANEPKLAEPITKAQRVFTCGHSFHVWVPGIVAYVNYATMYRRSPIGLPVPEILKQAKRGDQEEALNLLLQQLAWDAVVNHPLSGVQR